MKTHAATADVASNPTLHSVRRQNIWRRPGRRLAEDRPRLGFDVRRRLRVAEIDMSWIIVDEREGVGRVDTWSEYLCVSRTDNPKEYEVAICRHEVVAELPREWFDDDWQPLPDYADADGNLVLPEYYEIDGHHTKLTGHNGEYLLGELVLDEQFGGPITASLDGFPPLPDALAALGWKTSDLEELVQEIKRALSLVADL